MSLLNKFISPELKIKPKATNGRGRVGRVSAAKGMNSTASAVKSGMTVGVFGALKTQVVQAPQGGGGGGKK
jgi:hypothetical protein